MQILSEPVKTEYMSHDDNQDALPHPTPSHPPAHAAAPKQEVPSEDDEMPAVCHSYSLST